MRVCRPQHRVLKESQVYEGVALLPLQDVGHVGVGRRLAQVELVEFRPSDRELGFFNVHQDESFIVVVRLKAPEEIAADEAGHPGDGDDPAPLDPYDPFRRGLGPLGARLVAVALLLFSFLQPAHFITHGLCPSLDQGVSVPSRALNLKKVYLLEPNFFSMLRNLNHIQIVQTCQDGRGLKIILIISHLLIVATMTVPKVAKRMLGAQAARKAGMAPEWPRARQDEKRR